MTRLSIHDNMHNTSLKGFDVPARSDGKSKKHSGKAKKHSAYKKLLKSKKKEDFQEKLLRVLKKHFIPKKLK